MQLDCCNWDGGYSLDRIDRAFRINFSNQPYLDRNGSDNTSSSEALRALADGAGVRDKAFGIDKERLDIQKR